MKILSSFVLLMSISLLGSAQDDTYYTWVDENGVVNYAERAPVGTAYQEHREGEATTRAFGYPAQKRKEPEPPAPTNVAASDDPNAAILARNCQSAQEAMRKLNEFDQIILKDDNGVWAEASDEMKQAEIARAQSAIDEFCI